VKYEFHQWVHLGQVHWGKPGQGSARCGGGRPGQGDLSNASRHTLECRKTSQESGNIHGLYLSANELAANALGHITALEGDLVEANAYFPKCLEIYI
jgi:hypothetical protein